MSAVVKSIANATAVASEGPEPLRRTLPASTQYPMHALGQILGPAATRLHEVVKAPDAIGAQSVLAAASLAVQHIANVSIDGRIAPLSLWCATVSGSGERKSAVDGHALRSHVEFERERGEVYKAELKRFRTSLDAWEAARADARKKGKTAAAKLDQMEACGEEPEPPLTPNLLCSDPTWEGLQRLYRDGHPSIGLFSDEGGQLFGGHAMNKDNIAKSAAGLSKVWDGAAIDRIRAGDGALKMYGKRLASHVLMQPVIAEDVLSNETLVGQGFLARYLIAWPVPTAGTRMYDATDLSHDPAMQRYWRQMESLLHTPAEMRLGARNELEPRALGFSFEAKDEWVRVANAIEKAIGPEQMYCTIKAWASKAPEQIARIAGVLTLVEDPNALAIKLPEVEAATTLMAWYLDEAVRLVGLATVSHEIQRAEALLNWCRAKAFVYSTDMLQNGPSCLRESKLVDAAMSVLERTGWATFIDGGMVVDGKHRKKVWAMHSGAEA